MRIRSIHSAVLAILASATGLLACERPEETTPAGKAVEPTTKIGAIEDEPARYAGRTVTVTGEVERVFGPRALLLEGSGLLWAAEVPVIARSEILLGNSPVQMDDELIVTGEVRLAGADVPDLGPNLDPALESAIGKRPVLVATSIRKVGEFARWTADSTGAKVTSVLTITTNPAPADLAGESAELDGVKVQAIRDQAMWVGPSPMSQVLVIPTDRVLLSSLKEGESVDLRGTIKKVSPVDPAIRDLALAPPIREQVNDEPVYIDATITKSPR